MPEALSGQVSAFVFWQGEELPFVAPYGAELTQADILNLLPGCEVGQCLYEKSCGAIVCTQKEGKRLYFIIENRHHNWGFPKGHMEMGETETDTALREIFEETGLAPTLCDGFRHVLRYYVRESVHKTVVYFVGATQNCTVRLAEGEISSYKLLPLDEAMEQLTYRSERDLLVKADAFLQEGGQ